MKDYIYVLEDTTNGLVKVGISNDVEKRLKQIQYAIKNNLEDDEVMPNINIVTYVDNKPLSDRRFKETYSEFNVEHPIYHGGYGEWYKMNVDEVKMFIENGSKPMELFNTFDETGISFNGFEIETLKGVKGEEYLFFVKDLEKIFDLENARQNLRKNEKIKVSNQDISIVYKSYKRKLNNTGELFTTEKGLYRLAMNSTKTLAEPFQDWVCGEVLPQIRKTGKYVSPLILKDKMYDIVENNLKGGNVKPLIRDLLVLSTDVKLWGDMLEDVIRLQSSNINGEKTRLIKLIRDSIKPLRLEYQQRDDFDVSIYTQYTEIMATIERKFGNHKGMLK